jgi:hypothetical protein
VNHASTQSLNALRMGRPAAVQLLSLLWIGCGGPAPLTVDMPLHLEAQRQPAGRSVELAGARRRSRARCRHV